MLKRQTKSKEIPNEIKCFVHRLFLFKKRKRDNQLINTNPADERRARCPGRMPAWHLLPLHKWAGKWELLWG